MSLSAAEAKLKACLLPEGTHRWEQAGEKTSVHSFLTEAWKGTTCIHLPTISKSFVELKKLLYVVNQSSAEWGMR